LDTLATRKFKGMRNSDKAKAKATAANENKEKKLAAEDV